MLGYNNTDQQLHHLCQVLAKAGRTFVPKQEDDSHTNLYYDSVANRIITHWISSAKVPVVLALTLNSLHFEWQNSANEVLQSFPSIGKTRHEVEIAINKQLEQLGLESDDFLDDLHFEIPKYLFANDRIKDIPKADMLVWKKYRKLANTNCLAVLGHLQVAGEIRIWPHHFDTGIYVEVEHRIGIGFGLAMQDNMAGVPYFYMSGYMLNEGTLKYENLPKFDKGRWEIGEHWNGAILPINEIVDLDTNDYLSNSLDWFLKQ